MTIIWNKVTWYSKLLAVIVLAGAVWLGMYFYVEFKKVGEINSDLQMVDTNASDWKKYSNSIYGFKMEFIDSWKGFAVDTTVWNGRLIDGDKAYSGPLLVFKNPNTTPAQSWQNIPIMVFTHDVWDMVVQEKVVVSAAPIGPSKVGENSNYVFATPPRWYGFTDAIGFEEAVEIVKTFKSFEVSDQTSGWKTYKNEGYGFEIEVPIEWKIDDMLTKTVCCLNLFSSAEPYKDDMLKGTVTKIQFQHIFNTKTSSKEQFIQKGLEDKGLETLIINKDSVVEIENNNGLKILGFSSGISSHTYFIAKKSDFSEGLLVFVWGEEGPEVKSIISSFKFTK